MAIDAPDVRRETRTEGEAGGRRGDGVPHGAAPILPPGVAESTVERSRVAPASPRAGRYAGPAAPRQRSSHSQNASPSSAHRT